MAFTQQRQQLGNQYLEDRMIRSLLRRVLPKAMLESLEPSLTELGERVASEFYPEQLADHASEPVLESFDPWGNRIDRVRLTRFWERGPAIAAQYGLVATGYDEALGQHARLCQFGLVYLFTASSEFYSCPLAMSDGAARCLIASGNKRLIDRALPHLLSRDPKTFWTSGQWMTETTGGSDVGGTETSAQQDSKGRWRLYGRKWFTSAVVADMALTLARPEGNPAGADGLALYYLEPRRADGRFRHIVVDRLKDKLGTRKLPTAEIRLEGTPAELVGEPRQGVRQITPMLNITRIWNSVSAMSLLRRGIALARDYANRRIAFGMPLAEHALHAETLAGLQAELEAGFPPQLLHRRAARPRGNRARGRHGAEPAAPADPGGQAQHRQASRVGAERGVRVVRRRGLHRGHRHPHPAARRPGAADLGGHDQCAGARHAARAAPGRRIAFLADGAARSHGPGLDAGIRARDQAGAGSRHGGGRSGWRNTPSRTTRSPRVRAGSPTRSGRTLALALLVRHADWSLRAEHDPRPQAAVKRFARHGVLRLQVPGEGEARMLATDIYA
jgi:alkylation response protein AidB-like acyl-CoA dehydrogenase